MVSGRRDDFELSRLILDANQDFARRVRYCPDRKTNVGRIYYCDEATCIWKQKSEAFMEVLILDCVKRSPTCTLTAKEIMYVNTRCGTKNLLYAAARVLIDTRFDERLDANLDCFALNNILVTVDAGADHARRYILPGDFIKTTAGWRYDEDLAALHRGDVALFFEQLLPVPEERKAVLAFFASSLSRRHNSKKKLLALVDTLNPKGLLGNSGKSTMLALMGGFFGGYVYMCTTSYDEPFESDRLVIADERYTKNVLNTVHKKFIAGVRPSRSATRADFVWQPNIVIGFSEGDFPTFSRGDADFVQHLLVVPMRSKFVAAMPRRPDQHTFLMERHISEKFPRWRSALLDILLESL